MPSFPSPFHLFCVFPYDPLHKSLEFGWKWTIALFIDPIKRDNISLAPTSTESADRIESDSAINWAIVKPVQKSGHQRGRRCFICVCVCVCDVAGPERNFALELYGSESRCFEHSGPMWEERTCRQVRQWQHWGSGCYQYSCHAGRLHIIVIVWLTRFPPMIGPYFAASLTEFAPFAKTSRWRRFCLVFLFFVLYSCWAEICNRVLLGFIDRVSTQ